MEVCLDSIVGESEIWDRGGLQSTVRTILGDDYDIIPREIFDEEDLMFLSPTNFQKTVTA